MGSGGVVAEISSPDVSVVFSKGDGKYAFDTAPTTQNGKLNKTYASLPQKSGGTYNVPFKAISNSPYEKDVIVATVDFKNGKTKKDLVFKTQNGTAIDSTQITWNGNVATLTPEKTPKQAGLQLNDGETYADGKKLEIDDNSGFFKISSEGIGLVTILLKEGIVEEKTYLNTPPEGTVIKAPGLVTGSVEVVATKVTDLTTLATGVYDLATDKKARSDAYKGLVKIKESIGNDANTFIPILADVLLSAFSGNTAQDWKSLKESKTDEGKKSHLFTRGTENTVISGVVGVAFVKELPELAEKVSEKIGKVKNIGDELTTQLLKSGEDFTVLTNARKLPGVSSGGGKNITGTWLRGTERNAGLFPKSVADKLKGKTFTSFDDFRNQFWKAVADEQSLASQFDANSIQRMQGGLAPFTDVSQQIGGMKNYVLHHKTPINQGGAVYDMDNLYIVTPKYHKEILDPAYHYGYGY